MDYSEPRCIELTKVDRIRPNGLKLTKMDGTDRNAMLMLFNRGISTINAML